jgi:hypothetical protein
VLATSSDFHIPDDRAVKYSKVNTLFSSTIPLSVEVKYEHSPIHDKQPFYSVQCTFFIDEMFSINSLFLAKSITSYS